MSARFSTRKREITQDAKIDKRSVSGANQRLERFLRPFAESPWDHKPLLITLARQMATSIGEEDGVLAFDPSGFEKDGKKSAGVSRQWLGRFGKVDNGQVGTFLAYVTRKEYALVNAKLFIPREWNDDPERCKRAKIPRDEYETHKTRHEHCLEMLDEQGDLLPHRWITGDDEHGFISPHLAAQTGFTEDDLAILWDALVNMFEHDHSAARGEMSTCKLVIFKHATALGNAPSQSLFRRVGVRKNDAAKPARNFEDYTITVDCENLPGGVEIIEKP